MRTLVTAAPRRRRLVALALCLSAAVLPACATEVPDTSACRNLPQRKTGLSRSEYLPCAGEMIAALDELGEQSEAAFRGDLDARTEGRATLRRVTSLVNAAGGRNLLERWNDAALTDLNVDISNSVTKYQAFYLVDIMNDPHPYAAKTREAAEAELRGAIRRHQEARSLYRQLQ